MRITVDIPDTMYRLLKSRAASEGTSVKEMVLRGVKVVLAEDKPVGKSRLKLPLVKSRRPGTLEIDSEQIYDLVGPP